MNAQLKTGGKIAYGILKLFVPAIQQVEDRAKDVAHLKGDAKKAAAINLVKEGMKAAEDLSGHDLVNDPEFDAVLGDLNDVLVRLHKVTGKAPAAFAPATAVQLGVTTGSTGD
jgi:hypothetical protein